MNTEIPRRTALLAAWGAAMIASHGQAQPAPLAHTITYIEVAPADMRTVLTVLQAHATATRADPANLAFDLLRRIDRPHHFAVVERWRDAAAAETHRASPRVAAYRAAMAPSMIAAFDERPHGTLSIGAAGEAVGAIFAITHVDIIPPQREIGLAAVSRLAEVSRGTPGNLRFDALVQLSRPNHFTLVESWQDEDSLLRHAVAAPTRAFRDALLPMTGSLFDERLYRRVE